ncbi:hypothetical protein BMF94_3694 [Rhodotorula taiwanensis]|uniref:BTB domain-containing protein n=1 Tax=Rhodotorula taiwanensis TaxID=741276 RepID=A0A2S5B9A6_9BASI|nr:hypothetical protein BMF94_3694 [Rhodotorula taiwanensis]
MSNVTTVDLHALYASRAIAKTRAFLQRAINPAAGGSSGGGSNSGAGAGGSGNASGLSKSPNAHAGGWGTGGAQGLADRAIVAAEVNRRDHLGRTVLHLAVAEQDAWALEWVEMLLALPGLAVNLPDTESGWTALHRALYYGNIAAARLLLCRDDIDTRVKDHEGFTPFDVYNSTVDGTNPVPDPIGTNPSNPGRVELFSWGSNRNYSLGFASDSERAIPERVHLQREEGGKGLAAFEPLRVKEISMARLHTGIVTDERKNNIRLCGFGTGGRLGPTTQTQFTFAPLKGFPFEVSHVATSPDHTVVVTTSGDVWTFGLNRFSQLGYTLDLPAPSPFAKAGSAQEDPIQSSPRRVVGALKKEYVLGAAASRTHTAVFTADSLFTWGTNRGQLGYPAAGSPTQVLPRKVTMIDQPVVQLAATENATACLLDSGEVVVLYREQYVKIAFPLSIFPSRMLVYHPPNCDAKPSIRKLTACGNTFAALSSHGDLFTFSFEGGAAATAGPATSMSGYSTPPGGTGASTPTGSRVVPKTQRIWNVRRSFTAVTDIGVGLDGSLILSTVSGHVFTRTRKYDSSSKQSMNSSSTGGWKFTRIPNLQRVIRVAANSTGGYAALRADVPLRHIEIDGPSLSDDFSTLMPHWARVDGPEAVSAVDAAADRARRASGDASDNEDEPDAGIERDIVVSRLLVQILHSWDLTWEVHARGTDAMVQVGSLDIPAHRSLLSARSPVLAKRLTSSRSLKLDATPFAVLILLYYLYTDSFPAIWDGRVGGPLRETLDAMHGFEIDLATTKSDLRRLADELDLPALAQALERQAKTVPSPTLATTFGDLYTLVAASSPFADVLKPDVILRLADRDVPCHSVVLRARCPFFRTVFDDDEWYVARKHGGAVALDFNHIEWDVMSLVLEHVYRDAGMSLFQRVERSTAEQYIQHTVKILAVANELLLDKLKQVCSAVLRSFVKLSNVCSILSDAAFYEAHDLARACMYYLASSMETVLETDLLDELPHDLITALTAFVRERQGAKQPIARSGVLVQDLIARHQEYYLETDVARPTGAAKRYRPLIVPNSPRASPSQFSPALSPQLVASNGGHRSPAVRPSASPGLSPSLPALREVDEPFALDEDFLLEDGRASATQRVSGLVSPPTASAPPTLGRRRSSLAPTGSPSQASYMLLGSPPPTRLQPWQKPSEQGGSAPLDLRSIMAKESAAADRRASLTKTPSALPSSAPSVPVAGPSGLSSTAPSWRPVVPARSVSLASIQTEQKSVVSTPGRRPPAVSSSSSSLRTVPGSAPRELEASPGGSPSLRPVDPASAAGPVYTPTRLPSGSKSIPSGLRQSKSSFGGSDMPWQNFDRIATVAVSPPAAVAASTSLDPFAAPAPAASFMAIQSEQIAQLAAVKSHQAPRSFADVMAQEQADARRREQELKEEREFLVWFEQESKKYQGDSSGDPGRSSAKKGGQRGGKAKAGSGGNRGGKASTPSKKSAPDGVDGTAAAGPSSKRSGGGGGGRGKARGQGAANASPGPSPKPSAAVAQT